MIKNRIKQLIEVDWQNLKAIQPEDVKIQNNLDALKASLIKHGFSLPFAVWIDGADIYTIDGHTRKKALQELQAEGVEIADKLKAFEIEAKDRKEAVQILVEVFNQKHNPFDNEVLVNWLEIEEVDVELASVNVGGLDKKQTEYSKKIESPQYEVKNKKPEINELFNTAKYNDLISEIDKADLDDDVKMFLRLASTRFIEFRFSAIAEFYAHSAKEVQELMERNALVIIDFNSAIENGFVKLNEEIEHLYLQQDEP